MGFQRRCAVLFRLRKRFYLISNISAANTTRSRDQQAPHSLSTAQCALRPTPSGDKTLVIASCLCAQQDTFFPTPMHPPWELWFDVNGKVNLSRVCNGKAKEGMDAKRHSFLTSTLDMAEWMDSRFGRAKGLSSLEDSVLTMAKG